MLYLAGQFSWFLLAAFALACAMGWIGQSGPRLRCWSPAWSVLALLWGVGAIQTWFQFVNGVTAIWIETALLFVAIYWCGCACGGLLASWAVTRRVTPPVAETVQTKAKAPEPVAEGLSEAKAGPADNASSGDDRKPSRESKTPEPEAGTDTATDTADKPRP